MTSRDVLIRLRADVSDFVAKSQLAKAAVKDLHNEIDKSNDRTAWLAQGILALTPAVTRLGAGAVPVLSGMATQMMLTVAAAGTMALAFNGIGDALGALNDYQLAPTTENLSQLNTAMAKIGPSGQAMVEFLDSLGPAMSELSNSARDGMFPGMISGLEDFMTLAPRFNVVVREIGEGIGQLSAEAGEGLSGARFADFFDYLENDAKPILIEMGRTLGNFTDGLLNMLVAFDPLTKGFSRGLLEMSRSFVAWSDGLSASTGFQEFVSYVQDAGPDALDFLGSLIMMFVELAEAAAPVGTVMLPLLTGLANVIGDLANTPLGPATIALLAYTSAYGRLKALGTITGAGVMGKLTQGVKDNAAATRAAVPTLRQFGNAAAFALMPTTALTKSMESGSIMAGRTATSALNARGQVQAFGRAAGPVAGQIGLLAVAMSGVDDRMGLTNTTSLALAGSLMGPWGLAVGTGAGLLFDMKAGADAATTGLKGLDAAIETKNIELLTQRISEAKAELADQDKITGFGDFFSDNLRDLSTGGVGESVTNIYTQTIEESEDALADLKNAAHEAAQDKTLYNSIVAETAVLEANIQAMREKRAEALRGLNAELDYKASLLDARDALKENGKSVDESTRAGQANLRTLYGMAAGFNAQKDAAKNSAKEVRVAREAFVDMAVAMGMGEDKARRLAKRLYELPAKVPIEIGVDWETARDHIRAVKQELASIDRFIPVNIHVSRTGQGGDLPYVSGGTPSADGSFVPKTGLPYADRHHYLLADGEGVTTNRHGETDRFRDVVTGINAGLSRTQIKGMLADGGFGGPGRPTASSLDGFGRLTEQAMSMLLRAANRQLEAATLQQDAAQSQVDATRAQMDALGSATTSGFQTDLFSTTPGDSNPWAKGAKGPGGGWFDNLSGDIAGLAQRDQLQAALKAAGLDSEALAGALSQGTNADLSALLASGNVQGFEDMFNQRAALQVSVGANAGNLAYGSQFASQQAALDQTAAASRDAAAGVADLNATVQRLEKQLESAEGKSAENAERTGAAVGAAVASNGNRAARRRRRD